MNYKLISFLFSWLIADRVKRKKFRAKCNEKQNLKNIPKIQKRYLQKIKQLKKHKDKIKVLFLVNELSKWKAQSLYDLMEKSDVFVPVIAITLLTEAHQGKDKVRNNLQEMYDFFAKKDMNVVYAYKDNKYVNLKKFKPDIVFYQQAWSISSAQSLEKVSKYALTYYIPYHVNNYNVLPFEYNQSLHQFCYKYFVINKWWENEFKKNSKLNNIYGLGNTILDYFYLNKDKKTENNYVIYAPHYSFEHELNNNPVNFGTFTETGKLVLEYAKAHPEFNWVFKPHPQLKVALLKCGFPSNEVEQYYFDWEKIGTTCYNSDYLELFSNSKALITDCGSFLIEYFCTGKPIIHLISNKCEIEPIEFSKKIFDTFYKSNNNDELLEHLENILIKNNDFKRQERLEILKEVKLTDTYAALNILNDIKKDIGR